MYWDENDYRRMRDQYDSLTLLYPEQFPLIDRVAKAEAHARMERDGWPRKCQ